jgi:hypothetical protein
VPWRPHFARNDGKSGRRETGPGDPQRWNMFFVAGKSLLKNIGIHLEVIYIYIHSYIYISPVIIGHHGNILENPLGMEVDSWANYDEIIHIQWGYNRM